MAIDKLDLWWLECRRSASPQFSVGMMEAIVSAHYRWLTNAATRGAHEGVYHALAVSIPWLLVPGESSSPPRDRRGRRPAVESHGKHKSRPITPNRGSQITGRSVPRSWSTDALPA